jgi:uncharacterized OsmC-like protein
MDTTAIAAALARAETTFLRKPGLALRDDTPARAVLGAGLTTTVSHPDGHVVRTDIAAALGGDGVAVSPGWLLRAALAACTATLIAMRAARTGIALRTVQVDANSRSDARGILGLDDTVPAGPLAIDLRIQLSADGCDDAALRALVAWADAHSAVSDSVRRALDLRIEVETGDSLDA